VLLIQEMMKVNEREKYEDDVEELGERTAKNA
jgi:hypothetical protein